MNGTGTDTFIEWMSAALPASLELLEKKARADGVPVIRKSAQSLLGFFCTLVKPDRVLEIGSGVGFSALLMRNFAACRILGIELDADRAREAARNISKAGFAEDIEIRCADAADVLKELVQNGTTGQAAAGPFDLIFLDGPKGQYLQYLPDIEALIQPGGILVADNLLKEGEILRSRYAVTRRNRTIHARMREFITQMTHSEKWQTLLIGDGDGMMAAVRKKDTDNTADAQ